MCLGLEGCQVKRDLVVKHEAESEEIRRRVTLIWVRWRSRFFYVQDSIDMDAFDGKKFSLYRFVEVKNYG